MHARQGLPSEGCFRSMLHPFKAIQTTQLLHSFLCCTPVRQDGYNRLQQAALCLGRSSNSRDFTTTLRNKLAQVTLNT